MRSSSRALLVATDHTVDSLGRWIVIASVRAAKILTSNLHGHWNDFSVSHPACKRISMRLVLAKHQFSPYREWDQTRLSLRHRRGRGCYRLSPLRFRTMAFFFELAPRFLTVYPSCINFEIEFNAAASGAAEMLASCELSQPDLAANVRRPTTQYLSCKIKRKPLQRRECRCHVESLFSTQYLSPWVSQ